MHLPPALGQLQFSNYILPNTGLTHEHAGPFGPYRFEILRIHTSTCDFAQPPALPSLVTFCWQARLLSSATEYASLSNPYQMLGQKWGTRACRYALLSQYQQAIVATGEMALLLCRMNAFASEKSIRPLPCSILFAWRRKGQSSVEWLGGFGRFLQRSTLPGGPGSSGEKWDPS